MFADDTQLGVSDVNIDLIPEKLNEDLAKV